jgi:hypothetical protein
MCILLVLRFVDIGSFLSHCTYLWLRSHVYNMNLSITEARACSDVFVNYPVLYHGYVLHLESSTASPAGPLHCQKNHG